MYRSQVSTEYSGSINLYSNKFSIPFGVYIIDCNDNYSLGQIGSKEGFYRYNSYNGWSLFSTGILKQLPKNKVTKENQKTIERL